MDIPTANEFLLRNSSTDNEKMLIKFAIIFVSLINLNTLAEGFNQNRNFLDLDGYIYTAFRSCTEYTAFQRIVNFKRNERIISHDWWNFLIKKWILAKVWAI
jgi:hypothetical protein